MKAARAPVCGLVSTQVTDLEYDRLLHLRKLTSKQEVNQNYYNHLHSLGNFNHS